MNPEQALLGAILNGYDPADLIPIVAGRDFDQPAHEDIWRAVVRAYTAGKTPDPLTIRETLGATRLPGGPAYLHELMQACPIAANAPEYARQVTEAAARRRYDAAARRIHQLAEADLPIAELTEQAQRSIDEAAPGETSSTTVSIADIVPEIIDATKRETYPSPWPDLNRIITGFEPGRLYVVGARPGVGKSLILSMVASHAARRGVGVWLGSLEMSRREVATRVVASMSEIDMRVLEQPQGWNQRVADKLSNTWRELDELPLQVDDAAVQGVASIRATVRAQQRKHPVGIVCIDYLQLLTAVDASVSRVQQVSEQTRALKVMARELNVAVLLAAQLNREPTRGSGQPALSDLRESGSIEQDADVVLLAWRPNDEVPEVKLHVAKQRNGPTGHIELRLRGHVARLESTTDFERTA